MSGEDYLRKPNREDAIARAQRQARLKREAEFLQLEVDALREDHGSLTAEEVRAIGDRVRVGRYRWGKMGW